MRRTISVLLLAMLPAMTMAATCGGVAGTGKRVGVADPVTLSATEAKGLFVAKDGFWTQCPTPGPAPVYKDCIPPNSDFRTWSAGDNTCSTYNKYATSINDPARDKVIKHSQAAMWQQWQGPMRGALIERCTDGTRTVLTSYCSPAEYCDVKVTYAIGSKEYTYDARPRDKRVPIGTTVYAVATDGKTIPIRCEKGNFVKVK
jgi:hypothetical protein